MPRHRLGRELGYTLSRMPIHMLNHRLGRELGYTLSHMLNHMPSLGYALALLLLSSAISPISATPVDVVAEVDGSADFFHSLPDTFTDDGLFAFGDFNVTRASGDDIDVQAERPAGVDEQYLDWLVNETCWLEDAPGHVCPSSIGEECQLCLPGHEPDALFHCIPCTPGSAKGGYGNGTCAACVPGSAAGAVAAEACQICPVDTYAASARATACLECPPWSYTQNETGSTGCVCVPGSVYDAVSGRCVPCPLGTMWVFILVSPSCEACPPGRYSGEPGLTACAECVPETYAPTPGSPACSACPAYSSTFGVYGAAACYCEPGCVTSDSACLPCPSGWSWSGGACVPCSAGTFSSTERSFNCTACPYSTFAPASGATACLQCDVNEYYNHGASVLGLSACPCVPGSAPLPDASATCWPCPGGTVSVGELCVACPPGQYPSANQCVNCSAGTYAPVVGSSQCMQCPALTNSTAGSGTCSCVDWAVPTQGLQCALCPPGWTFQQPRACVACPAGTFSSAVNSSVCSACVAGKYAAGDGSSSCAACPSGWYSNASGASACLQCAYGVQISDPPGGGVRCVPIPPCVASGAYVNLSTNACVNCTQCPHGMFTRVACSLFSDAVCAPCSNCSDGELLARGCSMSSDTVCAKICNGGQVLTDSGCAFCAEGSYLPLGQPPVAASCAPCPGGTYWQSLNVCQACVNGTVSSPDRMSCLSACTAGQQLDTRSGSCVLCAPGTFSVNGTGLCAACGVDMYSPVAGASACESCGEGLAALPGSSACFPAVCPRQ